MLEFADVMCLAEGITPASIGPAGDAPGANPGAAKTGKFDIGALLRDRLSMGANKHSGDLTAAGAPVGTEGEKEEVVVAFVPPRREIGEQRYCTCTCVTC